MNANQSGMPLPHDHGTSDSAFLAQRPEQEAFEKVSYTFDLISDSTRLKILWLLCHSEECVTNIAAAIDMSPPAVSHHLRVLRQAGLITMRRIGKEAHYTLARSEEAQLVHHIVDLVFNINCKK